VLDRAEVHGVGARGRRRYIAAPLGPALEDSLGVRGGGRRLIGCDPPIALTESQCQQRLRHRAEDGDARRRPNRVGRLGEVGHALDLEGVSPAGFEWADSQNHLVARLSQMLDGLGNHAIESIV